MYLIFLKNVGFVKIFELKNPGVQLYHTKNAINKLKDPLTSNATVNVAFSCRNCSACFLYTNIERTVSSILQKENKS